MQGVIEVQDEIANSELHFGAVLELVCRRARELTGADSAEIELVENGEPVATASSGRRPTDAGSAAGVAIRHADQVAGVLRVASAAAHRFTGDQFTALGLLAGIVAVRLSTATVSSASGSLDRLTGLPDRRSFAGRLAIEAGRSRRYSRPLALCIIELHGLAAVNDKLGRRAGDEVLREAAGILAGARSTDEPFRLGGDQFALLMPQTDLEGAEAGGARLSASLVAAGLGQGRIGAAFGVAETDGDPVALHEAAAERLRLAKRRRAAARPARPEGARPRVVAVVRGRPLADAV